MSRSAYYVTLAAILCIVLIGCGDSRSSFEDAGSVITDSVLTATYPNLYRAVFSRDAAGIMPFTAHEDSRIRSQAWRTLAQTPVDSLRLIIDNVKKDGSEEAWFALSLHSLSANQLRDLERYWVNQPEHRSGISLVLGQQGDEETLNFLSDYVKEAAGRSYEKEYALAMSRLMIRSESSRDQKMAVVLHAFRSTDPQLIRSRLYGFYRGGDDMLTDAMKDSLIKHWKEWGAGKNENVDQYMAGTMGSRVFSDVVATYDSMGTLQPHVQLGIELAQMAGDVELIPQNEPGLKKLMTHENPHVAQQVLAGLSGRLEKDDQLTSFVRSEIADSEKTNPFVWVEAVNLLAEADPEMATSYTDELDAFADENPYLYSQALSVWEKTESMRLFLSRLKKTIASGRSLESMYAVNALNDFWTGLEGNAPPEIKDNVRERTFEALALGDRGVTYAVQPLLRDDALFVQDDFSRINGYLDTFELPGDIEVYQTFGSLYKERFEEQARPVIDSLAALNYPPLNRSLKQAGWNVEVKEEGETEFRKPDWDRLWQLGEHPIWVLETEKGIIKVEMNTLSAPVTVSAIDSLTRSGAYDGIPFHRVVPNFVIQGGDIERRDGFGSPEFTIPTEASNKGYVRGAAGIASAGPDTEGSQYFFMHQWKPHLNGRYSLFGHVIEGMNIVDQIVAGDRVIRARWE